MILDMEGKYFFPPYQLKDENMKNAKIVIGALWGDEAKGHMTHILSHSCSNSIVVRFNGGAQASHTVIGSDNMMHAFKHHGSGTFNGAATYLSKDFIINIFQFVLERDNLEKKLGNVPAIYVNPECIITTPYDEIVNQAVETLRGKSRHGSCGLGINETVERCNKTDYKITISDLFFEDVVEEKLRQIRDKYIPMRLKTEYGLSLSDLPKEFSVKLFDDMLITYFLFFSKVFIQKAIFASDNILNTFDNVIFEGAQGLLLDQNKVEMWPHVTTSNTGVTNAMKIINGLGFKDVVEVNYMCRVYMTKHGAGPFPHELFHIPYSRFEDKNNVPNRYQGALRFSYMDYDVLANSINGDLLNIQVNSKVNVVFSCIDQLSNNYYFYNNGSFNETKSDDVLKISRKLLEEKLGKLDNVYGINGIDANSLIK